MTRENASAQVRARARSGRPARPFAGPGRTALLTGLAMLAFAANSLLTRQALASGAADAAGFTALRLLSGAALAGMVWAAGRAEKRIPRADWRSALALFVYAALFSFAYVSLAAGTGALILFGSVQAVMMSAALIGGERFSAIAWIGFALALAGLVYLVSPGLSAPDPVAALLMAGSGAAWAVYSLIGRGVVDPIGATVNNFMFAAPLALLLGAVYAVDLTLSPAGVVLAIASGALASAGGYMLWYAALPGLSAGQAATVQLSAPAIAALGGALLLGETLTARLVVASAAILGGVGLALSQRMRERKR